MTQEETDVTWVEELRRANRWHTREKVALLQALKDRFGPEVVAVVDQVIAERAGRFGRMIAEREGGRSIADFLRLFWEPEQARGLVYTVEEQAGGVQITCTRCPMFDLAREINGTEWMAHLVCAADPYIVAGFNPRIGFRRTKTLMAGDEYCDHFFFMRE
jgi:predicted ArsR family transcriptional regulator